MLPDGTRTWIGISTYGIERDFNLYFKSFDSIGIHYNEPVQHTFKVSVARLSAPSTRNIIEGKASATFWFRFTLLKIIYKHSYCYIAHNKLSVEWLGRLGNPRISIIQPYGNKSN